MADQILDRNFDPNRIHFMQISPGGRLLAAFMGNEIYMKVINQPMQDELMD